MDAKEKAKELVTTFHKLDFRLHHPANYEIAKQCALICVDKILENRTDLITYDNKAIDGESSSLLLCDIKYWQSVKTEIPNIK